MLHKLHLCGPVTISLLTHDVTLKCSKLGFTIRNKLTGIQSQHFREKVGGQSCKYDVEAIEARCGGVSNGSGQCHLVALPGLTSALWQAPELPDLA